MFSKKPPEPAPVINNLSAHMHQRLDEAEREIHRQTQAYAQEQRRAMGMVARTVAPKYWDAALKAGTATPDGPTDKISGMTLATAIVTEFFETREAYYEMGRKDGVAEAGREAGQLAQLRAAQSAWQTEKQQFQTQVAQLEARLAALEAEYAHRTTTPARPAATRPTPEKWTPDWEEVGVPDEEPATADAAEDAPDVPLRRTEVFTPAAPENVWPDWFRDWGQTRTFYHARVWIEVLGETGEPLRTRASDEFARRQRLTAGSGGEKRALIELKHRGLVSETAVPLGSRTYGLLALTAPGLDAYRLLYGAEPAAPHYPRLLALHKSPEHTLLILLTQDVLERAGYQVERYPDPVPVGELGTMCPDLIAYRDGQTYYIEAETAAGKNDVQGAQKWRRVCVATGGRVYVSVPTKKALETVREHLARHTQELPNVKVAYLVIESTFSSRSPDFWQ